MPSNEGSAIFWRRCPFLCFQWLLSISRRGGHELRVHQRRGGRLGEWLVPHNSAFLEKASYLPRRNNQLRSILLRDDDYHFVDKDNFARVDDLHRPSGRRQGVHGDTVKFLSDAAIHSVENLL